MKTVIIVLLLKLGTVTLHAGELILPYPAFGPQAAAHKLIGMKWWQWESHGGSTPRDYPIKVVVFWDQSREETANNHPVDQAKLRDFRYVEFSKAITHMEKTIKEFQKADLDAKHIQEALSQLKKKHEADTKKGGK